VDNKSIKIFSSPVNSLINQPLMHSVETSAFSERGFVSTVHVLKSGEIIYSLQDFMKIESRFSWVDKKYLVTKILEMQKKTEDHSWWSMRTAIRSGNISIWTRHFSRFLIAEFHLPILHLLLRPVHHPGLHRRDPSPGLIPAVNHLHCLSHRDSMILLANHCHRMG